MPPVIFETVEGGARIAKFPVSKNQTAIIDAADLQKVGPYAWQFDDYVRRQETHPDGKRFTVMLHRLICDPPDHLEVDHKDGNPLNNRRNNLRIAEHRQNGKNRKTPKNNTSGVRGVHSRRGKWIAQISVDGKGRHLGIFHSIGEAKRVYEEACRKFHGEFASTR
jgi:hypothetical protein